MTRRTWIALGLAVAVAAAIGILLLRRDEPWRPELVDLPDAASPDECATGKLFVRPAPDGDRLIFEPTDQPERELLRGYADEWLDKPRCAPGRAKFLVMRGSGTLGDVYVGEFGGAIMPLTITGTVTAATWSHDGATAIFTSRTGDRFQLLEIPVAHQPLAFDATSSLEVSSDGQRLVFTREETRFSILGGAGTSQPRELISRNRPASHLRVASPTGEVLLAESDGQVLVIDTIAGSERVLTAGQRPFPSLDGKTVYFRAADDPKQLMAIPLAGGAAKPIAKLEGRIVAGTDGPDGQHVMIDEDEHHLVSFRVSGAELTDEGAHWVVPAPSGEWRFWQKPGRELELRVIAPGKPLGSMDCVFDVDSMFNQWLDAHHLAYAHDRAWHILDVRTCTDEKPLVTVIDIGDHAGPDAVIAPDGTHWFSPKTVRRATRHAMTNFASRPRTQ